MNRKQISQLLRTKCTYMNIFAPKIPGAGVTVFTGTAASAEAQVEKEPIILSSPDPCSFHALPSFSPEIPEALLSYRYIKKENISVLPVIPFRKNKTSTLFLIISHLPNFPNPPLL